MFVTLETSISFEEQHNGLYDMPLSVVAVFYVWTMDELLSFHVPPKSLWK